MFKLEISIGSRLGADGRFMLTESMCIIRFEFDKSGRFSGIGGRDDEDAVDWLLSWRLENSFTFIILQKGLNEGRKEGDLLFKNALNTSYLRIYLVRHMVMDHSDSETAFVTPVVEQ